MPTATRQTSPGPSTAVSAVLQPHINTKKRSGSEVVEDGRDAKKIKVDGEAASHFSVNGKEKKKKKKKKKKRISVVLQDHEHRERPRSLSRSAPVSSNRQRADVNGEQLIPNGMAIGNVDRGDHEPSASSSDKGKGKAKSDSAPQRISPLPEQPVASGSGLSNATSSDSFAHALEMARLKEQLATQNQLLERHQTHLNHHQQSLTCQICLDLMHKPYALTPCGHITCYCCLVRWFTAPQHPNEAGGVNGQPPVEDRDDIEGILNSATAHRGTFVRRRKTCPVCRAAVVERPVEMWGIKSMVANLVRSGLVDLPAPVQQQSAVEGADGGNNDPWQNVFRRAGAPPGRNDFMHAFFPGMYPPAARPPQPQEDGDRERMGWYDTEDGGIYRCIDCYHEIWDGVCSGCNRGYPGHGHHDDDDDDDDDDEDDDGLSDLEGDPRFRNGVRRFVNALVGLEDEDEDEDDFDVDMDDEEDLLWGGGHPDIDDDLYGDDVDYDFDFGHRGYGVELTDSEEDDDPDDLHRFHLAFEQLHRGHPRVAPNQNDGGIARIEEVHDEEEDSQYEGSFIDDGQGGSSDDDVEVVDEQIQGGNNTRARRRLPPHPRARHQAAVVHDSDDAEEPAHDEVDVPAPRRTQRLRPAVVEDEDDDMEENDESEVDEIVRRLSSRRLPTPSDDDDGGQRNLFQDAREAARQLGQGMRIGARRPVARRAVVYESEEEDDQDEGGQDVVLDDDHDEDEEEEEELPRRRSGRRRPVIRR